MAVQQYVLSGDGNGAYRFVTHYLTPIGNNAAGISWANAVVGAGLNTTSLSIGTGAGQINSSDAALITAGTMIEVAGNIYDASTPTIAQSKLNTTSAAIIADSKARLQIVLNYFGFTQGVAT